MVVPGSIPKMIFSLLKKVIFTNYMSVDREHHKATYFKRAIVNITIVNPTE